MVLACDEGEETLIDEPHALELRSGKGLTSSEIIAEERSPGGGGIWVNNGLSVPLIGGVDPAYALSSPLGLHEQDGVLADPETRVAARYLIECALPAGATVTKLVDGAPLELVGHVGLAPEWENGDCDDDCQQWVSACMLARTNISAQSIPVVLRGQHTALGSSGQPGYDVYEASFFGNIFADPAAQYMCSGSEEAAVEAHLAGRTCSSDAASCGFEEYDDCWEEQRCDFVWDDGWTAVDCTVENDPTSYHTISVYIMEIEDEDEDDGNGGGNGNGNGGGNGNGNGGGNGNGNGGGNGNGCNY